VEIDVSAAAVVEGTTALIGPPSIPARIGSFWRCCSIADHPSPSSTSSTTLRAVATASGNHGKNSPPSSAGTSAPTHMPS
jgi:hypothetical protein